VATEVLGGGGGGPLDNNRAPGFSDREKISDLSPVYILGVKIWLSRAINAAAYFVLCGILF
jgi:hypothetical protein